MKTPTSHYYIFHSPIIYKDAEESQEVVKLLFTCIVTANLHFSVNFQQITYIFPSHSPFYTPVSDKLKHWVRIVTLKYISTTDPTVGFTHSRDCVATFIY